MRVFDPPNITFSLSLSLLQVCVMSVACVAFLLLMKELKSKEAEMRKEYKKDNGGEEYPKYET